MEKPADENSGKEQAPIPDFVIPSALHVRKAYWPAEYGNPDLPRDALEEALHRTQLEQEMAAFIEGERAQLPSIFPLPRPFEMTGQREPVIIRLRSEFDHQLQIGALQPEIQRDSKTHQESPLIPFGASINAALRYFSLFRRYDRNGREFCILRINTRSFIVVSWGISLPNPDRPSAPIATYTVELVEEVEIENQKRAWLSRFVNFKRLWESGFASDKTQVGMTFSEWWQTIVMNQGFLARAIVFTNKDFREHPEKQVAGLSGLSESVMQFFEVRVDKYRSLIAVAWALDVPVPKPEEMPKNHADLPTVHLFTPALERKYREFTQEMQQFLLTFRDIHLKYDTAGVENRYKELDTIVPALREKMQISQPANVVSQRLASFSQLNNTVQLEQILTFFKAVAEIPNADDNGAVQLAMMNLITWIELVADEYIASQMLQRVYINARSFELTTSFTGEQEEDDPDRMLAEQLQREEMERFQ